MMSQVPQASGKAVLLGLAVLLVAGGAAETSEIQDEGQMEKRVLGQNQSDMMTLLKTLQARVAQLETQRMILIRGKDGRTGKPGIPGAPGVRGRPGRNGQLGPRGPRCYRGPGGVQYIRWGRTTCPWGATLVYKGRIGSGNHPDSGGGGFYVCLPENPRYGRYKDGYQEIAAMYGTEYELSSFNPFTRNLHDHDALCAVCYVTTRSAKMMIPATYECPAGWSREYHGYLMTEKWNHGHASNFICVDQYAEAVPGTHANLNGALLYPVEGVCGSLPCHPYVTGRELTCAVCTK
ncbi:short-chain collagen C4-like [Actinia tenebrosa]|uniref:Short-chain collagen C4-like n=1 Tax=Actinia tenebrosa TaxID=6105 RepID=A0A6P8I6Q8_ACTTE|nr:short-chain collagen C4-like [Actinia tenebrosa]